MHIDLTKLSASDLDALIAEASAFKSHKYAAELTAHCDLFVKNSKAAGYTLKEVIAELKKFPDSGSTAEAKPVSKRAGVPRPIKYKGPNGETWAGGGRTPKWITASGKDKVDFAV